MRKKIIVIMVIGCLVLVGGVFLVRASEDRQGPEIVQEEDSLSYREGDAYDALLEGITAEEVDVPAEIEMDNLPVETEDESEEDNTDAATKVTPESLTPENPVITLTDTSVTVTKGSEINRIIYVKDITDDKDDRQTLYQNIRIRGEFDTE